MVGAMEGPIRILPLNELPAGLEALCAEAARDGFHFMDRLMAEWRMGTNRFDQPGEVLLGAFECNGLIGTCGLNRDPYALQGRIGRLRHLYIRRSARRRGVASRLVARILDQAEGVFDTIRLRTDTAEAAAFYVRHGFVRAEAADASHIKLLRP